MNSGGFTNSYQQLVSTSSNGCLQPMGCQLLISRHQTYITANIYNSRATIGINGIGLSTSGCDSTSIPITVHSIKMTQWTTKWTIVEYIPIAAVNTIDPKTATRNSFYFGFRSLSWICSWKKHEQPTTWTWHSVSWVIILPKNIGMSRYMYPLDPSGYLTWQWINPTFIDVYGSVHP